MPADKPVTVVLMRPDVQVGELAAGGLPQPNADWTTAARRNIAEALERNQAARNIDFRIMDATTPEATQLISDYESLHRAAANAIVEFAYGSQLPTKKGKKGQYVFDWTLGPGAQRIAEMSGANYALFFFTLDNFSSASRKAMQAVGMLGCLVGACVIVRGGVHISYVSMVELSTGNIVWFNIQRGSEGDVREVDGARSLVDALMASMPTRAGDQAVTAAKAK